MSKEKARKKRDAPKDGGCSICTHFMNTKLRTIFKIFSYCILIITILYGTFFIVSYRKAFHIDNPITTNELEKTMPVVWIYTNKNDTGFLKHVRIVLKRLGYREGRNDSDWDLLWAHDYPFRIFYPALSNLQPHQLVNHFPGCGYITNKVDLSTSKGQFIPAAFKLPEEKEALLRYVALNPKKRFVTKLNDHRGVRIQPINDADLTANESFIQEYIEKPFLVDGFKFDIGVYTVITSIDPLRVYVYKGDVLFRFCPIKYHPFNPEILDKYVVGDDYLPIWKVPSLSKYYSELRFSMKDSFDAYVTSQGKNATKMWDDVDEAIREITLMKEAQIKEVVKRFSSGRNFFELVRIDFTLDEDLNVFTMEANMSPNLSSAHYPPNQLLYEQVLFNLFALVGVSQRVRKNSLRIRDNAEREMEVANKNLVVFPEICAQCTDCFRMECQLCSTCFTMETRSILIESFLEHQNRMNYQRIFPPPQNQVTILGNYTWKNQLLVKWYQGKCELDSTWCN